MSNNVFPITVNLTYFKPSGKFYAEGTFNLDVKWVNPGLPYMYDVFDAVRNRAKEGTLPGLNPGTWEGPIHVACANGLGYPGIVFSSR